MAQTAVIIIIVLQSTYTAAKRHSVKYCVKLWLIEFFFFQHNAAVMIFPWTIFQNLIQHAKRLARERDNRLDEIIYILYGTSGRQ